MHDIVERGRSLISGLKSILLPLPCSDGSWVLILLSWVRIILIIFERLLVLEVGFILRHLLVDVEQLVRVLLEVVGVRLPDEEEQVARVACALVAWVSGFSGGRLHFCGALTVVQSFHQKDYL